MNLRTESEEDQPMSPEEERQAVEKAGMRYIHLPVSSATMGSETVDKFRAQLPNCEGPVLVSGVAEVVRKQEAGWSYVKSGI